MLISVVMNVDTNYNVPRSQNTTNDPVEENEKAYVSRYIRSLRLTSTAI